MKAKFALLIILIVYVFLAGETVFRFDLDHGGSGGYISYNHLAESFLAHKLHLLVEPNPELLAMEDPFEPSKNDKVRWQDGSLYKDKYYMYFGPTPALVLYLPYKYFRGGALSDTFVSCAFTFGTVIWGILILLLIKKRYFTELPLGPLKMS